MTYSNGYLMIKGTCKNEKYLVYDLKQNDSYSFGY